MFTFFFILTFVFICQVIDILIFVTRRDEYTGFHAYVAHMDKAHVKLMKVLVTAIFITGVAWVVIHERVVQIKKLQETTHTLYNQS